MCRLVENVFQNLFLQYRSCRIGTLELLTKVNFQDSGSQPRITCYFARGIIMTVNHTINHSIAKYCYVKGHFWVFRWRYTFAGTV